MAFRAEDRYQGVADLALDVEAVIDGRTPSAESASMLRQAARFYVGRDPAMSELRVMDIDMWLGAGWLLGLGIGLALGRWFGHYWWIALTLAITAAVVPTSRWIRNRRALRKPSR